MINKEENPKFLNEYLEYSATILNKSKGTVKEYGYDIAHFLKYLRYRFNKDVIPKGTVNPDRLSYPEIIKCIDIKDLDYDFLEKIKIEDIHAFLYYLKDGYNVSPVTLARRASSIRSFFKYETRITKKLKDNPTINLETPKIPKKLPVYLNLDESKRLLEAVENPSLNSKSSDKFIERNTAIITLFLNCGLRLGELIDININDIDFKEQKVRIRGKGNKERELFLNNACNKAIKNYLKVRPIEDVPEEYKDALFLSERKNRISRRSVQYIVKSELQKAGINTEKYSAHKLRHTAATLMYQHGHVDIRALQKVLGHESIATTEIYTHLNEEQVKEALESNPLANL